MEKLIRKASKVVCVVCVLLAATVVLCAQTLTTLYSFDGGANGSVPYGALIQGINGYLYGTTNGSEAPANGDGTIYKMTTSGKVKTLHSFCLKSGCADGNEALAGLVQDTNGAFYGTTTYGGANGYGTVFKITAGGKLTALYSFCSGAGCLDGESPTGTLILSTDGNLYGTTYYGGTYGHGTVYKITTSGALTTLYSFCSQNGCADGANPTAGVIQATDGNFYGETDFGGTNGQGSLFKISATGALTTLYSFCSQPDCADGSQPVAGLVEGNDGNFYGTTTGFGGGSTADGTVFKMTPTGGLATLHSFDGTDGTNPEAPLIQATDGNFYGTTYQHGASPDGGTVFQITPSGTLTTLYNFCSQPNCADGLEPQFGGLLQDTNGDFYGVTAYGGTNDSCAYGCGTVFSLSIGLGPFVATRPTSGKVRAKVIILGTDLTGATAVSFNGTAATFKVVSSTEITTKVPKGATTGPVTVTTPGGTLTSNVAFQVTQ